MPDFVNNSCSLLLGQCEFGAEQAVPLGALALALDEFFALPVMETPIDVLAHRD